MKNKTKPKCNKDGKVLRECLSTLKTLKLHCSDKWHERIHVKMGIFLPFVLILKEGRLIIKPPNYL